MSSLVVSRRQEQDIIIGDDIEVKVVDVRGGKVRLKITAPNHVPINRREVYEAKQRDKRENGDGNG